MEYLVKDNPSVLIDKLTGQAYPFSAEEEIFVLIDNDLKQLISFDFEKRKLYARCIIRFIDYEKGKISEVSAITPKFNIKSTFASFPFEDSDITFLGGGFTASAVSRNGRIGIIASVPDLELPNGDKGLKIEVFLNGCKDEKSFNCLLSYDKKTESLHASLINEITGTIWLGEKKKEISGDKFQGRHIWKRTSFPKRKEKPIGIINGSTDNKPFSAIILTYDDSLTINASSCTKRFENIKWIYEDNDTIFISDDKGIKVKAKVFSSIHEKQGPFRKARTFRYAVFSGAIGDITFDEAVGYLEYPDRL